jgi:DHA2 family multidrug resistance protein
MAMETLSMDPRQRLMVVMSLMLATTIQVLDTTIANVALPHMQGTLSATQEQVSWVLTSYIVATAIMIPMTGFIAERIGRKNLLLVSVAGFTVASMLCGISESLAEIVFFRVVQGAFGAALVPLSQSILLDSYPKEQHGSAMALWGVGIMVGPILGPTLGGYLTEYMNWRWVFYINVPLGILGFMGLAAFMPESDRGPGRPFDLIGFAMLSLSIGALQLALDRGHSEDWLESGEIVIELVVAALGLYLFILRMFMARHPFIDRHVFLDRNFVIGLFLIFMMGILILAAAVLLPPFLQNIRGMPVETAGLILSPRGVGTMISMMVSGRLINRVDTRLLMGTGILLVAYSLWEMSKFNMYVPIGPVVYTGFVQGFGLGLVFIPLTTIAYATLAPRLRTEAASLFSLFRNIGSSIGISVVFTILARGTQVSHADLVQHVTPFDAGFPVFYQFEGASGHPALKALSLVDAEITRQAATIAFMNDFLAMAWMTVLMLPLVFLLKMPKKGQKMVEQAVME